MGPATSHGQELGAPAVAAGAGVDRSLSEGGPDPVDMVCILEAQLACLAELGALSAGEPPPAAVKRYGCRRRLFRLPKTSSSVAGSDRSRRFSSA